MYIFFIPHGGKNDSDDFVLGCIELPFLLEDTGRAINPPFLEYSQDLTEI